MDNLTTSNSQLSLTPLGAGDLIDRAVRLYRKNFWTFIWIAAPPIIVGTLISVGWTILARNLFIVDMVNNPGETMLYYWFLWFGNMFIWLIETVATFTVMGGSARNFVRHMLFGERLSFGETYKNVKSRFFALVWASFLISILLGFISFAIFILFYIVTLIAILITFAAFSFSPFLITIISTALFLSLAIGAGWLFFLIAANFMYIPQAMMVEGLGVMAAIRRSSTLARGNVKRLYALFIFTMLAIYSALALFYVPLGWYAWIEGVQILTFDADAIPAWYEIASKFIGQLSLILLMPVWMIGLCLLYVDERVRHEGYDIELMAARRLGEIPALPKDYTSPLQPAVTRKSFLDDLPKRKESHTMLGLD